MSKMSFVASVLAAGATGWAARDVLIANQVMVTDDSGQTRLTLTVDPVEGPMILMLDADGTELRRITSQPDAAPPIAENPNDSTPMETISSTSGRLLAIETIGPDEINLAAAERLRREAADLERDAALADAESRSLRDSRYPHERDKSAVKAQEASNLRGKARELARRAARMQREAMSKTQVLLVWTGTNYCVIESERDLSQPLSRIGIGGFLEWSGTLIGAQGQVERWKTRVVREATSPPDFTEEPAPADRPAIR